MRPSVAVAERRGGKIILATVASAVLIAAAIALLHFYGSESFLEPKHENIEDLQGLPNGRVHLRGVLTYVDVFRRRFWVQATRGEKSGRSCPQDKILPAVNSTVQLTGVAETVHEPTGFAIWQRLWIQGGDDLAVVREAPQSATLSSLRSLYAARNAREGHQIRLRGRVAAQIGPRSLLLEDGWGAIACGFDSPQTVPAGTVVEVAGFPASDGPRIDLLHSRPAPLAPRDAGDEVRLHSPQLTSVAALRALNADQANSALPVRVTGVVPFVDEDWRQLFLQDSTGGIYVKYSGTRSRLFRGERLTVIGLINAGDYAPVIVAPKFIAGPKSGLPKPVQITARDASSGVMDSLFVEVEEVVHPLKARASICIRRSGRSTWRRLPTLANWILCGNSRMPAFACVEFAERFSIRGGSWLDSRCQFRA